jgi:hypothetical protein
MSLVDNFCSFRYRYCLCEEKKEHSGLDCQLGPLELNLIKKKFLGDELRSLVSYRYAMMFSFSKFTSPIFEP